MDSIIELKRQKLRCMERIEEIPTNIKELEEELQVCKNAIKSIKISIKIKEIEILKGTSK